MVTEFTPYSGMLGGALIGLASILLLSMNGRIAGISGILGGVLAPIRGDWAWRVVFICGLVLGGTLWPVITGRPVQFQMPAGLSALLLGGLCVGFGTQLGSGCTSGHGVCGIARASVRSIAATVVFLVFGMLTVFAVR